MNLFITAAIGSKELMAAAIRLKSQMEAHSLFDNYVIVQESDLPLICPWLLEWYSEAELRDLPGYGFYAWKSAIAEAAMSGFWGDVETSMYLDAGCEVLPGMRSKRILRNLLATAVDEGVVAFNTFCPEWQYSKKELMAYFPNLPEHVISNQIQGGTWVLSGGKGRDFAKKWNSATSMGPELTNNTLGPQRAGFIANRNDQSVMSLTFKSMQFEVSSRFTPNPGPKMFSQLKALRFPIWATRNRSSKVSIRPTIRLIARILR
jgi:hypothetical protein